MLRRLTLSLYLAVCSISVITTDHGSRLVLYESVNKIYNSDIDRVTEFRALF
jgi:hypothetical protein